MQEQTLTLGHSPDPDDAFMFYALAKGLIPTPGWRFQHVLQDIQTLNERAMRGELDISAISIHAYAYVSDQYALLPSGASMGDGYGPLLVALRAFSRADIRRRRIAVPGMMTSAFLALQLWLERPAAELDCVVVPFDAVFRAVRESRADVGLIIHEGQLTYDREGLTVCADLGRWWSESQDGLPLPLGGNVIHKRHSPAVRRQIADLLAASIRYSLEHRAEAVARYRADLLAASGGKSDFVPHTFQVPVSVAIAKVAADHSLIEVRTLDRPKFRPQVITRSFWRGWDKHGQPTLVTFNGRFFDLPVLELSAYRYGIAVPPWSMSGRWQKSLSFLSA